MAGPGPVWNDLEGAAHDPLDPGAELATVLVFYSQDCPISKGYVPELNRLSANYTNFAFYVIEVDPEVTTEAARKHVREYGLSVPVLLDSRRQLVKVAGAEVTPEAVVLDRKSVVRYRGRIDDLYAALGKKRARVTRHDLRDALDSIAAGKRVKQKETKAIGCLIEPR
jgi:thiol-disulfide isomerase/thioredoxin